MVEIDEGTALPELLPEFISGDNLAGLPNEGSQELQRLSLKPYTDAMFPQLTRGFIEGKRAKSLTMGRPRDGPAAHWNHIGFRAYQM